MAPEPSYPNARPGELPPVRPIDVLTDQGAEAFAVYFVKTLDWAYATMDTTLVSAASSSECNFCAAFVTTVGSKRVAGDVYLGSRITIRDSEVYTIADPLLRLTNVAFAYTALAIRHADGSLEASGESQDLVQLNVHVRFSNSHWIAYDAKRVA